MYILLKSFETILSKLWYNPIKHNLIENKNTYKFLYYIFSAAKFSKDFRDFFQENAIEMRRIHIFCESIMQLLG